MRKCRMIMVVLAVVMCCGILGCGEAMPRFFGYRESGFSAELRGKRGEGDLVLTICAEAPGENGERSITVCFFAPSAMENTVVSVLCDKEGELMGRGRVVRGDFSFEVEAETLAGLLLPATCLLSLDEPTTLCREGDLYRLRFSEDTELTFDLDGTPRSLTGEGLSLEIICFEPLQGG